MHEKGGRAGEAGHIRRGDWEKGVCVWGRAVAEKEEKIVSKEGKNAQCTFLVKFHVPLDS